MPDFRESLAAEAARRQPTQQPPFEVLVRRRRARDWRQRAGAIGLTIAIGAGIGGLVMLKGIRPTTFDPADPATTTVETSPHGDGDGATVAGTMQVTGGPEGATPSGVSGTVLFRAADGVTSAATARDDGSFTVTLKPGQYSVTGTSTAFGDGAYLCRTDAPVVVSTKGLTGVLVACSRR